MLLLYIYLIIAIITWAVLATALVVQSVDNPHFNDNLKVSIGTDSSVVANTVLVITSVVLAIAWPITFLLVLHSIKKDKDKNK